MAEQPAGECPIQVVLAGEPIDCTFPRGHVPPHSWEIPGAAIVVRGQVSAAFPPGTLSPCSRCNGSGTEPAGEPGDTVTVSREDLKMVLTMAHLHTPRGFHPGDLLVRLGAIARGDAR